MEEIDLYDLLRFYVKKWLTIAIFVMIAGIAGIIFTYYIQSPKYESKATLLLVGANRTSTQDSVVLNNYVELFTSRRVLEPVIADQGYEHNYETTVKGVVAQNVKNTDVIDVSIVTDNADTSKRMLEGTIESFRSQAKELYGDNNIKINTVDGANAPSSPTNVRPLLQIGATMVAGLAVAVIGLFFVYDYQHLRRNRIVKQLAEKPTKTKAVPAKPTRAVAAKTGRKSAARKSTTAIKKATTLSKVKPTTKK